MSANYGQRPVLHSLPVQAGRQTKAEKQEVSTMKKRMFQAVGLGVAGVLFLNGCASNDEPEYPPAETAVIVEPRPRPMPPRHARPQARVEQPAPARGQQPLTPKPGPEFEWIPAHRDATGFLVPGHWQYTGPARHNQAWVPRHRENNQWVNGKWVEVTPPQVGMKYVPGHYGPDATWVEGYWE
jgi:hypothetical protein